MYGTGRHIRMAWDYRRGKKVEDERWDERAETWCIRSSTILAFQGSFLIASSTSLVLAHLDPWGMAAASSQVFAINLVDLEAKTTY